MSYHYLIQKLLLSVHVLRRDHKTLQVSPF